MKVVAFSTYYSRGGAGKAAYSFCRLLVDVGVDLKLFTSESVEECGCENWMHSITTSESRTWKYIDILARRLLRIRNLGLFSSGIVGRVNRNEFEAAIENADVVLLFWINDGFLSIADIRSVARRKVPVFWRLSDMWPLSSGLHYTDNESDAKLPVISRHCLKLLRSYKFQSFRDLSLTYLAPSRWMFDLAAPFGPVVHLPTTVDLDMFTPVNRKYGREKYGFNNDCYYLLFGAESSTTDERKGFDLLSDALSRLPEYFLGRSIKLVVFGNAANTERLGLPFEIIEFGRIEARHELAVLYAACDLFVAPARMENLANTCLEAIAAGLPVVSFDIGGMPDVITDSVNGFLTEPFDTKQFAINIMSSLEKFREFSLASRQLAEKRFSRVEAVINLEKAGFIKNES